MPDEVFKIQRPMAPTDAPWMIYNKDGTWEGLVPARDFPESVVEMMGGEPKIYVRGHVDADGKLQITERVRRQEW